MTMLLYQVQVVREAEDLEEKIKALRTFLDNPEETTSLLELERLHKQLVVMREYDRILRERISHFSGELR